MNIEVIIIKIIAYSSLSYALGNLYLIIKQIYKNKKKNNATENDDSIIKTPRKRR